MDDPPALRRRVLADRLPPPPLRAFPSHSTCNHNIRKGLRPQAHVNGRNGGDALTPCVANASQTNPHTKFAALFGAQLKAQEAAPVSGVMGGQGHAKSTTFCYKSTRTPKIFAPAAGCDRLRREVLLASAGARRPSWRHTTTGTIWLGFTSASRVTAPCVFHRHSERRHAGGAISG